MSEELYFNNELRKCLNAAGLSDCGENDAWNYWYQRVHKAHDQAIDGVTEVQRAENAKLRLQIHWLKKGDVYAYEAGYHNGATNYELDHCPSCKNIADLQDALDENVKLRELVRDMYAAIGELCARQDCDACKLRDEGACERGVLTARACVLGVEVEA